MATRSPSRVMPKRLATDLLRERDAVVKSARFRAELEARVKRYEVHYKFESHAVHDAIDRGQLIENDEVCRWLIDYDLLTRTRAR